MITAALALCAPPHAGAVAERSAHAAGSQEVSGWASLSAAGRAVISATVGRDDAAYRVHHPAGVPTLDNVGQHFTARFTPTGAEVGTGNSRWGLGLAAIGRGGSLTAVPIALPVTEANRVDYRRGSVTEWYLNGPAGLEQGFTLAGRPAGDPADPLTLAVGSPDALTGKVDPGGAGMVLIHGSDSLAYRGLAVSDATGRSLPAHLGLDGGQVQIQVDDQDAQYPVTVDPFVQTAKLIASDGATNNQLGAPVAISGNTVVAGASNTKVGANAAQGAVYVFAAPVGPAGTLTQLAELTASDGFVNAFFGTSVAIDGDTIVVGCHNTKVGANTHQGAAYVFVRPPGGWAGSQTESAKLTASDGVGGDQLGESVAISGGTVIAGADTAKVGASGAQGAAYVFTRPAGGWAGAQIEAAKLTATDGAANDQFGESAAISGNTIVLDAPQASVGGNTEQGAVYVFVEPVGGWVGPVSQSAKLTATDSGAGNRLGGGQSLAISANTVVAGAQNAQVGGHNGQGAAYVFVQPPGGWAGPQTESATLTASDGTFNDALGDAVGISGNTVVAGARGAQIGANVLQGAAYAFDRPVGGWTGPQQESLKLVAADGALGDRFGSGIAVGGNTLVVGAPTATVGGVTDQGAAYVFDVPSPTGTTLSVTPASTAVPGTAETLVATVNPAGTGTVQFMDGSTPLGSAVPLTAGTASLTASLAGGTHSLAAVFTPTDPTAFAGSTSATVSYSVVPKRPFCIRRCG